MHASAMLSCSSQENMETRKRLGGGGGEEENGES